MSKEFVERIRSVRPKSNEVAIIFMGQAGFIIKDSEGLLYAVDVYFSDCCEREFGFKRLIPKVLEPSEIVFDYVLTTHAHYDHFDIDAMPALMNNTQTKLYTTPDGIEECRNIGIQGANEISLGNEYVVGNMTLKTVFCDHGEMKPEAVAFLMKIAGKTIYLAGDTSYHPEEAAKMRNENIDLLFVAINGAFGNLNEEQAVDYTKIIEPKNVVPCHYGNFKEHGGDVNKFNALFTDAKLTSNNMNLTVGDIIIL